ncbi:hypothetical protein PRZ48_005387 [Zasmidium cellare]|uniref:GATA-type domain-containing protein n=1 Tax=Zasmidium cellare TaxID=395010 RepID=A0ABR0ETP8_ZASCE|nr:hypothetical protein PRZ48_005387 [Zasmidium cellare]
MATSPQDRLSTFPADLVGEVVKWFPPSDQINLHLAVHSNQPSTFQLTAIDCLHRINQDLCLRNNLLDNLELCKEIKVGRGDKRVSLAPAKLSPSEESGLDTTKTYSQYYADFWSGAPGHLSRRTIQKHKKADFRSLRYNLFFKSRARRQNTDRTRFPKSVSKYGINMQYVALLEANARETEGLDSPAGRQLLVNERRAIEAVREADDDVAFQANALMRVIWEIARNPAYLPQTCRECLCHSTDAKMRTSDRGLPLCIKCAKKYRKIGISA